MTDPAVSRSTVIRARRILIGQRWEAADLHVRDEIIASIASFGAPLPPGAALRIVDDACVVLPAFLDSHVHINEPGRTEWEGFATATAAAAAGGVACLLDMPLNSIPPTTTTQALAIKRDAARGMITIDVGFWAGAVPENLGMLGRLVEAGVFGFKCFLAPSGVEEFGSLNLQQMERAMAEVADLDSRLVVHAEDPNLLVPGGPLGRAYQPFLASRPDASETSAIAAVVDTARRTGARVHILHLSSAQALPIIRRAKAEGIRVTAETCPHYLTLAAEDIPDGATQFKCCPPIRSRANQDLLWAGVLDGTIDAIVSDHSPSTLERKRAGDGDFGLAWGGISGLQVGFAATWTTARRLGLPLERIVPLFTTGPARVAGLGRPALIAIGAPANLALFAPEASFRVDARRLAHKNPISAYDGALLHGRVEETWLRGQPVHPAAATVPTGRLIEPVVGRPATPRGEA